MTPGQRGRLRRDDRGLVGALLDDSRDQPIENGQLALLLAVTPDVIVSSRDVARDVGDVAGRLHEAEAQDVVPLDGDALGGKVCQAHLGAALECRCNVSAWLLTMVQA